MKNLTFVKAFLLIGIFTLGSFAISYAFAAIAGDKPYPQGVLAKLEKRMNSDGKEIKEDKYWDMTEVVTLEVTTGSVDVELADAKDDKIRAELSGWAAKDTQLEEQKTGNTLRLRVDKKGTSHWNFNFGDRSEGTPRPLKLRISVPEKYKGKVKLQTGSGDISAKNANLEDTEIRTGSGDVGMHDLNANKLTIKTGSGEIHLKEILGSNLEISTGSGDVNVRLKGDASRWTARATTSSGDIDSNFPGATGKGSKSFAAGQGPSQLNVQTSSGDIEIKL